MAQVVGFVPDLMDRSKVAAAFGDRCRFVRTPAEICDVADVPLVLVDLSRPGALDAACSVGPGARVVGFAPHVDEAALEALVAAGHEGLARSVFFRRLDGLAADLDESSPPQVRGSSPE